MVFDLLLAAIALLPLAMVSAPSLNERDPGCEPNR